MSRSKKAQSALANRSTSGSYDGDSLTFGEEFIDLDLSAPKGQLDGAIDFGRFKVTPLGLEHKNDWSLDEWQEFGRWLNRLKDAVQWVLGDWAIMAFENADNWISDEELLDDDKSNESKYRHLIEKSGYAYGTLRNFKSIAERIPLSRRRDNPIVKFSHYVEVAPLDEIRQENLLDLVEKEGLSIRQLREEIHGIEKKISTRKKLADASDKHRDRVLSLAMKKGSKKKDWQKFALDQAQKWKVLADQIIDDT